MCAAKQPRQESCQRQHTAGVVRGEEELHPGVSHLHENGQRVESTGNLFHSADASFDSYLFLFLGCVQSESARQRHCTFQAELRFRRQRFLPGRFRRAALGVDTTAQARTGKSGPDRNRFEVRKTSFLLLLTDLTQLSFRCPGARAAPKWANPGSIRGRRCLSSGSRKMHKMENVNKDKSQD